MEILSYRDAKHVDEVMKAMESDKRANEMYKESMEIITPGSIVFGDFNRLKETFWIVISFSTIFKNSYNQC